jgi:hypothetical protein
MAFNDLSGKYTRTIDVAYFYSGFMRYAESGDITALRKELEKGLSINTRDEHGCTFLHWAAAGSKVEMVEYLIQVSLNYYCL